MGVVGDSEKAALNVAKHGITFDRALDVFFDPLHELLEASVDKDELPPWVEIGSLGCCMLCIWIWNARQSA